MEKEEFFNEVSVHLVSQSHPIKHTRVDNTYTKDGMYCLLIDGKVVKYPLCNIFRVVENY